MSIFVQSAAAAIAAAVKQAGVWVAWGSGSVGWDTVAVPEPVNAAALVAEIGRRRAQTIEFVTPNAGGSISVPQGNYAISASPTDTLYIRCIFATTDSPTAFIREAAVFVGATLANGLPAGMDYFAPSAIATPGTMLMLGRFAKITRSDDFSVALEFIITL